MKIKLSNVLRGKERKKQRNKCRKNIIGFKKLKIRIIKKRKEKKQKKKEKGKLHRTAKAQHRGRSV